MTPGASALVDDLAPDHAVVGPVRGVVVPARGGAATAGPPAARGTGTDAQPGAGRSARPAAAGRAAG